MNLRCHFTLLSQKKQNHENLKIGFLDSTIIKKLSMVVGSGLHF